MGNNLMQDPINALQNLASQGSRNNQIMTMGNQGNQMQTGSVIGGNVAASNLLQTLTQVMIFLNFYYFLHEMIL